MDKTDKTKYKQTQTNRKWKAIVPHRNVSQYSIFQRVARTIVRESPHRSSQFKTFGTDYRAKTISKVLSSEQSGELFDRLFPRVLYSIERQACMNSEILRVEGSKKGMFSGLPVLFEGIKNCHNFVASRYKFLPRNTNWWFDPPNLKSLSHNKLI